MLGPERQGRNINMAGQFQQKAMAGHYQNGGWVWLGTVGKRVFAAESLDQIFLLTT
jgi:hypothetical protein